MIKIVLHFSDKKKLEIRKIVLPLQITTANIDK